MIKTYTYKNNTTISVGDQLTVENQRYLILDIYGFLNTFYIVYRDCVNPVEETETQIKDIDVFFALFSSYFHTLTPYILQPNEVQALESSANSPCCSNKRL